MNSHYKGTESPNKSHNHIQNKYKQFYRQQRLLPAPSFSNSQSIQIISLPQQNIIKNLEIYAWRSKTYLPILKPTYIVVTPEQYSNPQNLHFQFDTSNINNQLCHENYNKNFIALKDFVDKSPHIQNYKVRVQIEEVKCKLKEVNQLPLPQFLYLLKETLIGFELLFDIFGYFKVTDEMIIVNASSQWKVWISQNYRSNQKNQGFQSQKQVLINLITLLQKHYMISSASKQLLNTLKQIVQEKQPTFLKILSKINQYISTHKVFQVNRFTLPLNRNSKPIVSQKSSIETPSLKKLSRDSRNTPAKKKQLNYFPQSPKQPISQQQISKFTINPNIKRFNPDEYYFKNYQTNIKPTFFQHLPKNMQKLNFQSYTSQMMSLKVQSPVSNKNLSSFNTPTKNVQKNTHLTPQNKKFTNVFNLNRSGKLFQGNKKNGANLDVNKYNYNHLQSTGLEANKYREAKSPDPAKLQAPIRCTSGNAQLQLLQTTDFTQINTKPLRKYSDNLQKIRSANALLNVQKKIAGSSIYEAENMGKLKKHLSMNEHEAFKIRIHNNNKNSSQVSPNNSSSTKQVKNSGQMSKDLIPGYLKLKQKDLGLNKMKNSLSFVSNQPRDEVDRIISGVDKNMAVSHQFQSSKKKNLISQKQYPTKLDLLNVGSDNQWVNSISGLFSENVSIKHLKQSVKVKGQQQEPFEKEHLKDVKLQMLQKFGRKVDHMVVQQDLQRKYSTQILNKSMQLIQQQISQVKSHLQSERREDEDLKPKQIRSKHQTMQVQAKPPTSQKIKKQVNSDQYSSQYDDKDADSEIPSQSSMKQQIKTPAFSQQDNGFSFQTQMYVINPKKKH